MTQEEILKELDLVFKKVLKFSIFDIDIEKKLSDIKGWDSLSNINIVEEVESKFNINLYAGEIVILRTVSDLVQLIQSKL